MIELMVETLKPAKLDCGIEVNKYLNYAQIQQIVNAVVRFDTWSERQENIDILVLFHATNLTKEQIEEIGHDSFVTSGVMDKVNAEICNLDKVYQAIQYTESNTRALSKIANNLPELVNSSVKKVMTNGKKATSKK